MTVTAHHAHLVVAAQAGDRSAREALIAEHLPLLYNVVGRALDGHSDVDDVVQETLLRVLRDLPALRSPESFRSWLVAIALRQIATHRQRVRTAAHRATAVNPEEQIPHVGNVENEAILRLHVSDQRRQVVEASHWLDPAYRPLLSLWWQECAGRLNRSEVAAASDLTVAHVGVRLQRMREQLELGRTIVAALAAEPRCPQLAATVQGWDGHRTPVWRKRITRHIRGCPTCTAPAEGRVAAERLLLGIAPLAVPAGLTAALAAKGVLAGTATGAPVLAAAYPAAAGTVPGVSLLGKLSQAVAAHPLASAAAGAVLVTGTAVVAVQPGPAPAPPPAAVAAPTPPVERPVPPSPTAVPPSPAPSSAASSAPTATRSSVPAGTIPLGTWSLESVEPQGRYLTVDGEFAAAGVVRAASGPDVRQRATFTVSRGLADADCVTLRAADGRYLRHSNLRLRLSPDEGTRLFREDATFCPRPGAVGNSVTLQSHNYPALVVRHRDGGYWIDVSDGTSTFGAESSFVVRTPWA